MVEGGVHRVDKAEFRECLHLSWRRPYILRLAMSAGIGGLLFGYDTGVISGALLYIRDQFPSVDRSTTLQETIVSMAVAGAIVGAAIGGWMNDQYGRRFSILVADVLFMAGAVVMAVSPMPALLICGRILVGLGVGMASMNAPLYISEASPARIRGALVSTNGLLITGGQFLAYCINLAFTKAPGTWRWMLGIAGVPAIVQFVLMLFLPESPRWLYRKNRKEEAQEILERIYPPHEVEQELEALRQSVEAQMAEEASIDSGDGFRSVFTRAKSAWSNTVVRRGLIAGIICQVAQQFVGINTIMYYSPTIVQLAGFASNSTAMALSLITSGLNAIGSIISMAFVDKFGRRKLLLISMVGIILCLFGLFAVFEVASKHAPPVSKFETAHFGNNSCPGYMTSPSYAKWNCISCLAATPECGFCANAVNKLHPGACLAVNPSARRVCDGGRRTWYSRGCPSNVGMLAVLVLGLYIISYSPGMGTVPWIVNSEIYPLRYRGICGGMAAVANWTSNLIVSQLFLTLTDHLGPAFTFFLFGGVSCLAFVAIFFFVPETKGLSFEEVEKMLGKRSWKVWKPNTVQRSSN